MRLLIKVICTCASIFVAADAAFAKQAMDAADLDRVVTRAMETYSVPGVAVGVVKDGKLVVSKGYGVREIGKPGKVDADTLFAIGSNTKAFTTAALAILVDEGKIRWDDKVIDYLPDFRLYDPYVTREFTLRDLLTHRSGLGLGAGDLLFVPSTDFTRSDILHALRNLKPVSSFRSQFDYDNLLYVVAGQIIPAVTGLSWEDFVESRILHRLGMEPCAVNMARVKDRAEVAAPHTEVDGQLKVIAVQDLQLVAPAGAIQCNLNGMAKWIQVQLSGGKTASGGSLFSTEQQQEMWAPQTIQRTLSDFDKMNGTHFKAYGLGWGLSDLHGYKQVAHNGGVMGMVSRVVVIPELRLGVVVLTNQQNVPALMSIAMQIVDAYTGAARRDWVAYFKQMDEKMRQSDAAALAQIRHPADASAVKPTLPLEAYVGEYYDAWRGDAAVRLDGGRLVLKFSHTNGLEGALEPYSGNIFVVRWNDRSLNADAYVRFSQDFGAAKIDGMTLRAVLPSTDFSFDFQDLDFSKIR